MKKGLTLIELLISITFIAALAAVVSLVFMVGLKSWTSGRNYAEVIDSGGLTMGKMVRELSMASEITKAESDEIEFEADVDGDNSADTIKYDIDKSGDLIKTMGSGKSKTEVILIEDVQTFGLGYYLDQDDTLYDSVSTKGKGTTEADGIQVVVISLSLSEGDETTTLGGSAYTRNQGLDD